MTLINLLPQDTRIVELTSGFALIILGMLMMFSGRGVTSGMIELSYVQFWFIITLVFGFLQIASIVLCTTMEHIRFVLAWFTGSFWVWTSAELIQTDITPAAVAAMVLGIMNLYAFIVNLLLVKRSWN